MITAAVLAAFSSALSAVLSLIPSFTLPGFLSSESIAAAFSTIEGYLAPFAAWVDFSTAFGAAGFVLSVQVALFVAQITLRGLLFVRGAR